MAHNVYIDDKADMKFQLHHLHLEKYVMQQQHDKNLMTYVSITVYLLHLMYIDKCRENIQHSMLDNPD